MFSKMSKHQHQLKTVFEHRCEPQPMANESVVLGQGLRVCIVKFLGDPDAVLCKPLLKHSQLSKREKHSPQTKQNFPPVSARPMDVQHRLMPERIQELAGYQRPAKSNNIIGRNKTQLASPWNIAAHEGGGWALAVVYEQLWTKLWNPSSL